LGDCGPKLLLTAHTGRKRVSTDHVGSWLELMENLRHWRTFEDMKNFKKKQSFN